LKTNTILINHLHSEIEYPHQEEEEWQKKQLKEDIVEALQAEEESACIVSSKM